MCLLLPPLEGSTISGKLCPWTQHGFPCGPALFSGKAPPALGLLPGADTHSFF